MAVVKIRTYIQDTLFPFPGHSKFGIGFLCLGLCIGVAVRAGMLWFVDYRFDGGDTMDYLTRAHNLLEYHIYSGDLNSAPVPSLYRPPFYPFFLAFITWIFGSNPLYVQMSQLVLSLITALLITRVTAYLIPMAAPWVFGIMMLSPYEAVYAGAVLSESITTFLLVAAASAILTMEGLKRWMIGGVLLGLCVLTRDVYLPLVLLIAGCWIVLGKGTRRSRSLDAAVLVLSACLVILPWTLRNYSVTKRFVPVSEGRLGFSLWMGTWATNGAFTAGDAVDQRVYPPEAFRSQAEKEFVDNALEQGISKAEPIFRSLAVQRIYDEPFAVLGTYLIREPLLWLGTRFDIFILNAKWFPRNSHLWRAVKAVLWGGNFLLMLLGIAGIVLAWRLRNSVLVLVLPLLYTALVYFPLNSFENRYSQPVYPFVLVFAGIAAARLADKLNRTRQGGNKLWQMT